MNNLQAVIHLNMLVSILKNKHNSLYIKRHEILCHNCQVSDCITLMDENVDTITKNNTYIQLEATKKCEVMFMSHHWNI